MRSFDLVVVGTGTAALSAAMPVREAGWTILMVDFRPFGGTCALRGCDPKKMLVSGAETVDLARRMHGNGVAGDTRIDWPALMAFKRRYTDPIPASTEQWLKENGIEARSGRARFTGPATIAINGEEVEAKHMLLAAGAEPVKLGIPGEEHVIANEEFLALERMPRRVALVGGGYIAAEFSHIAARAGAAVTVLQRADRMLPHFDPDLVDLLMEKFRAVGIDVRLDATVEAVEKARDGTFSVHASSHGTTVRIEADLVVHAAGRKPDLASLDLAAANVAVKDGKLALNDFLQSESNPRVYAAGDAAQKGPALTPVSAYDGEVVAENLLRGNRRTVDYTGVPSVAFTVPPIAAVGLTESDAQSRGLRFRSNYKRVPDWYTARRVAEAVYGYKTLVEEKTDRILGAHLVGPHADEVINLFALAIRKGMTAADLRRSMFTYPTAGSDVPSML